MDAEGFGFTVLLINMLAKQGYKDKTIENVLANTPNNKAAEEMFFSF